MMLVYDVIMFLQELHLNLRSSMEVPHTVDGKNPAI